MYHDCCLILIQNVCVVFSVNLLLCEEKKIPFNSRQQNVKGYQTNSVIR